MKTALKYFGYAFLVANISLCGYTLYVVQTESEHFSYVQSVYTPYLTGLAYARGCTDMGGDRGLCKMGGTIVEEETRELLKLEE